METNIIIKNILNELEQKRNNAEKKVELKKEEFYKKYPEYKNIEDNINKLFIKKSQYILFNKSQEDINLLDKEINSLLKKKEDFLSKLKINSTYFEPEYECKICKDTGFIENSDGTTIQCKCIKQKIINEIYNKCNIGNLEKDNFDNFIYELYSDEIDFDKYNSNISPRENIKQIRNITENFINNFDDINEKNLLFTGKPGLR